MGNGFEIAIVDSATRTDRAELEARLNEYNRERTGFRDDRALSCFLRDERGELVAGIDGFSWGGYARIDVLWVAESARGQSLGRRLVTAFEEEALARGCGTVVLSSHEFQAPQFYANLGFEIVGETVDTPRGYRELLFQKRLAAGA